MAIHEFQFQNKTYNADFYFREDGNGFKCTVSLLSDNLKNRFGTDSLQFGFNKVGHITLLLENNDEQDLKVRLVTAIQLEYASNFNI